MWAVQYLAQNEEQIDGFIKFCTTRDMEYNINGSVTNLTFL